MANKQTDKRDARLKRALRIRRKVQGTALRPRLVVFKSLNHIYAQLVNDLEQKTITGVSSLKGSANATGKKVEKAKVVGTAIAAKAKERGITEVVFDRSGYLYHGKVKALAEAARKAGLKF
jgi:large subunit ribosomal protein L18